MRLPRRLSLLVLVCIGCGWPLQVAADTSPAVEYVNLLRDSLVALQASPPDRVAALVPLQQLNGPSARYSSGDALDPVVADLTAAAPDIADARLRLMALIGVLELPQDSAPPRDPQAAHSVLDQVYGSPTFRNLDATRDRSWGERVLDALNSVLSHVGGALGQGGSIVLLLILLALLTTLAVWLIRRNAGRRQQPPPREPVGDGVDPDLEWQLAQAAAARGDHREAIRRAFRSALLAAASRGRLPLDASWTSRELLRQVEADGELLAQLAPAAAAFDEAWYSDHAVTEQHWLVARTRCATVRALAARRSPVAAP